MLQDVSRTVFRHVENIGEESAISHPSLMRHNLQSWLFNRVSPLLAILKLHPRRLMLCDLRVGVGCRNGCVTRNRREQRRDFKRNEVDRRRVVGACLRLVRSEDF
jgi:hypothetical protein